MATALLLGLAPNGAMAQNDTAGGTGPSVRTTVKAFEKASKNVKLAELKAWVDKTLPTLQAHLAAAAKPPQNANR